MSNSALAVHLDYLLKEMQEASASADTEAAHLKADVTILHVLDVLSEYFDDDIAKKIKELKSVYDEVGKWYA